MPQLKKNVAFLFAMLLVLPLFASCEKEQEELPAATTVGVPEQTEKSEATEGDFTFTLYQTYASLTAYNGDAESVLIPDTVQNLPVILIGESAFADNETLKKITLPAYLRSVDRYAFQNCVNLSEVVWNESLESIADYAFRQSGITEFAPSCPLYSIGRNCFYGCLNLKSVSLPETVTVVREYAFSGCTALVSFAFSPRLSSLSNRLFSGDTALESVILPETVTEVGTYCFAGCTGLTSVVAEGDPEVEEGAFNGCSSLVLIAKAGTNFEKYASRNGCAFETSAEEK